MKISSSLLLLTSMFMFCPVQAGGHDGYDSCFEKVWHKAYSENRCSSKTIKCPGNCVKVANEIIAGLKNQCGIKGERLFINTNAPGYIDMAKGKIVYPTHVVVKVGNECADNGRIGGGFGLFPCGELERYRVISKY